MAYQLRVYAPTGAGIVSIRAVTNPGGQLLATGTPQGTSTPCINLSGQTTGFTLTATLENGVSVDSWKINADGTVYYSYLDSCSFNYDASYSNIQIALSVSGTPSTTTTWYAQLVFNANGGSGAPGTLYGSVESQQSSGTVYIQFTIPLTEPTRSGYIFAGWATSASATAAERYPGGTYTGYGSTTYPGTLHTLYAVWSKEQETGLVNVWNGAWYKATPWVWNGAWYRAVPWVWNGAWQKGG